MLQRLKRLKWKALLIALSAFLLWFAFCLPQPLFTKPNSVILLDREGSLLAAQIASDEQWRFPEIDSLPQRFVTALVAFEDRRFYEHPGVSIKALARATRQNLQEGRIVSGGSTLTMQLVRLSRDNPERTVIEKLTEVFRALRLELRYSKEEILRFYCTHAPMGGNVVGVEAAAWRYFRRSPHNISWAEAATLAVLPNAPGLIHPGKNREALRQKRNRLLQYLHESGHFDALTLELSIEEPLPDAPEPLPQHALHLLHTLARKQSGQQRFTTTLDARLQVEVQKRVDLHSAVLQNNLVHNAAALVADARTGEVLAYIGNSNGNGNGHHVDIVQSLRSPGSSLKPMLYTAMLDEGLLLPDQWVRDVPVNFNGFAPKNFSETHHGVVPASDALAHSLNIPAVIGLKEYGVGPFMEKLRALGFNGLNQSADHYGLSLILGGGEVRLWELVDAWSRYTRILHHYQNENGAYPSSISALTATRSSAEGEKPHPKKHTAPVATAGSIYATFKALEKLRRPDDAINWEQMSSSAAIAWKTGTSYGFRDAWAVGCTPEYIVGVWTGNADGTGRPGVIGTRSSGPLMFQLFDLLPLEHRFVPPFDDLVELELCSTTGFKASRFCPSTGRELVPQSCTNAGVCQHHQPILLSPTQRYRVTPLCSDNGQPTNWLVLPPVEAWYYRQREPSYKPLPPYKDGCEADRTNTTLAVLYPVEGSTLTPTRDFDGATMPVIAETFSHSKAALVHWHLNGTYLGATRELHQMPIKFDDEGTQLLRVIDEDGNTHQVSFFVKRKHS